MNTSPIDPNDSCDRLSLAAFSFMTAAVWVTGSLVLYGLSYLAT